MLNLRSAAAAVAFLVASAAPLSIAACAQYPGVRARPAQLDTSLEHKSDHGTYEVRVEPLETPVKAHRLHNWTVTLQHGGKPVDTAMIAFDGGMPEHGHGYPTKPKVAAAADGRYVIRGVKFSMRGWWEMKLAIQSPAGADTVTFNLVI
jgi:hypothetical protein